MENVPWKDIATIGTASVGAILGIMNTWNSINQRRVRLRVTPAFATDLSGNPIGFSIEVINLSAFSVTVTEVGFDAGGGKRALVHCYTMLDGKQFPRRMEAREAVSAYFGPADFSPPKGVKLGKAYARTACGRTLFGDSPARKQFSNMMADLAR